MSPSTNSASSGTCRGPWPPCTCSTSRSYTRTSCPAASSDSATCEPMKPAPPVMSTRATLSAPFEDISGLPVASSRTAVRPCRRSPLPRGRPRPLTSGSNHLDRANVSCQGAMLLAGSDATMPVFVVEPPAPDVIEASLRPRRPYSLAASAGRSDPTRRFHGGVLDLALLTAAGAGRDPGVAAARRRSGGADRRARPGRRAGRPALRARGRCRPHALPPPGRRRSAARGRGAAAGGCAAGAAGDGRPRPRSGRCAAS